MCTCDQRLHKLSNPLGLIHGDYMFPPTNPFPAAELVTASIVQIDFEATCEQCSTILFSLTHSPCVSLAFLLNVGIELTANQCQSVCVCVLLAEALPLGQCEALKLAAKHTSVDDNTYLISPLGCCSDFRLL